MSFHKRHISDEQVIDIYRSQGCQAVIDWYTKGVDALILSGKLTERVENMLPLLSTSNKLNCCPRRVAETRTVWEQRAKISGDPANSLDC